MSMTERSLESENAMLAEDHEYALWLADRDQESRQQQDYEAVALAGMTSILTRHRRTMEIGKELGRYEEIERQSLTASRIEQGTIEMAGRNAALQLALRKVEAERDQQAIIIHELRAELGISRQTWRESSS